MKTMDKERETSEKIKEIEKIEEIVANISHELKTPITVALSSLELAIEEKNKEEVKYLINLAKKSGERLKFVVENLINHVYLKKHAHELEFGAVNIEEAIDEAIERLEIKIEEKNIKVEKNIEHGLEVFGNKNRLVFAFCNLIDNAIKFNIKNGKILISGRKKDGEVEITIEDTGIGIPKKEMDKIFADFYQISSGEKRKYAGLGLGLCVVRAILEIHKGKIKVESNENMGSRFIVTLKSYGSMKKRQQVNNLL